MGKVGDVVYVGEVRHVGEVRGVRKVGDVVHICWRSERIERCRRSGDM